MSFTVAIDEPRAERCENCRFFQPPLGISRESYCHRRSPLPYDFMRFYALELFRDLAWAVRIIAKIDPELDEEGADINTEATEALKMAHWPEVETWDWCGEWEPRRVAPGATADRANDA